MSMKSAAPGSGTSGPEVTNVSEHGFWLLLEAEQSFVPFADFPWFRDAAIRAITRVDQQGPLHLYWPELDVDLSVESIRNPARFPLVAREGL
jgi:hypothetical protein